MQGNYMFNKLFDLTLNSTSEKSSLEILGESIDLAREVIEHFSEHYSKDHKTFDASIDTFCQILQEHKSKK